MRTLDRYILSNFLIPFLYCVLGFVAIWLVFDLSDNGPDFIEGRIGLHKVAWFYMTQLPDIMVISLPVGLLLALLYSLSRMSRSNEIISMLTAGVSLPRVLLPLFIVGLLITGLSTLLNYEKAPHAQAFKEKQLETFKAGEERETAITGLLFRNRKQHRTWFAQKFKPEQGVLDRAQVIQQDAEGNLEFKYYARRMTYYPDEKKWHLDKGVFVRFDKEGNVTDKSWLTGDTFIHDWDETPWRIASANMQPDVLSVPELKEYLVHNSDFPPTQLAPFHTHLHYRWALPWMCFIVVFLAAPLGIVFSRRGVLSGVASSIFIFFAMMFLTNLFLALGSGGRIPPFWAAWTPGILFAIIGCYLLWMRATNRDVPKFGFRSLFDQLAKPTPAPEP